MKTTIAGIQFTDKGILIEKAYCDNSEVLNKTRINTEDFTGKFVKIAHNLAKTRMAHCFKQLHSNLAKATHITKEHIAWADGHFSVPVWNELEGILEIQDVRQLNAFQTQQLIRAILFQSSTWAYDYDENYIKCPNSSIEITDTFKMFLTEHMLVCKSQEFRG